MGEDGDSNTTVARCFAKKGCGATSPTYGTSDDLLSHSELILGADVMASPGLVRILYVRLLKLPKKLWSNRDETFISHGSLCINALPRLVNQGHSAL